MYVKRKRYISKEIGLDYKLMTMDYNLARKLKDAGFPQPYGQREDGSDRMFWFDDKNIIPYRIADGIREDNGFLINKMERLCFIPTLSELIEACGTDFGALKRIGIVDNQYRAEDYPFQDFCEAKYPEEAVGRLWLKLKGRQK
mgnify:CR=1 FL=1